MNISLTAVLLTGGLSTRMGRDKATLLLAGQPLWVRQLNLLRKLKPATIWVSARVRPEWSPPDVEVVLDPPPSRGPLSGVAAALARMQTSHLLVLALDLPSMTSEHLGKLVDLALPGQGLVSRNEGYWEPLAAIYPKEAAPVAQAALGGSDVSLQSFVRQLLALDLVREHILSPEELGRYHNLNRPQDFNP